MSEAVNESYDSPEPKPEKLTKESYQATEQDSEERKLLDLKLQQLDAFGSSIAETRTEAIAARQTSGIEEIWREDEEFYEGIDDLNRGDERSMSRTMKPTEGSRGFARRNKRRSSRSRVFPNITGPFVDTAAAHMADTLLPTDERPWKYEPTPIPELAELASQYEEENPEEAKAESKKGNLTKIAQAVTNYFSGETEQRNDELIEQNQGKTPEQAFKEMEVSRAKCEATMFRVWDWQTESNILAEIRKVIESSAKCGVGILKGPSGRDKKSIGWSPERTEKVDGVDTIIPGKITVTDDIAPGSKFIDKWNFYPHGACGQNIQNGAYVWERDYITKKQLRDLKGQRGYIDIQIDRCLEEGAKRAEASLPESHTISTDVELKDMYEIWYFSGTAERMNLEVAECDCEEIQDPHIATQITMVNNHVIKAALPTLDHGGYEYDVFCWRKREKYWAGIGVARQIRVAQKIVVGGTREMMNNAGLAGGPMIVYKQGVVRPADGVAGIGPRKVYYIAKEDQTIADATKAIGSVKVDMLVNEMMVIINLGHQLAEQTSGFPMMMQGQMGSMPDRVGVVNVADKNTNTVKRRLARLFTDDVTGPHLQRYYIFHLQYGPDNEKGDLKVNVKGYGALVERDIKNQQLGQLLNLALEPRFGLDPKKVAAEYMKSLHFVYEDLKVEDQEWQGMLENWAGMMQQAGDSRVQVAEIMAASRLQDTQLRMEYQGAGKIADHQHAAEQAELDRQILLVRDGVHKEVEMLKRHGVSNDVIKKLKTDLAKEVMKIKSVYNLANMKAPADQLPSPPVEPAGRAPDGESFQK